MRDSRKGLDELLCEGWSEGSVGKNTCRRPRFGPLHPSQLLEFKGSFLLFWSLWARSTNDIQTFMTPNSSLPYASISDDFYLLVVNTTFSIVC